VFLFALENRNAIGPLARARENGANAMKTVLAVAAGLLVLLLAEAAAQAADIVVMSSTGLQAALEAVSYTHLDVYKRQNLFMSFNGGCSALNAFLPPTQMGWKLLGIVTVHLKRWRMMLKQRLLRRREFSMQKSWWRRN